MSTDMLSNLLSSIKNASMAGKTFFETAYFKQGKEVLDLLKSANLLKEVKVFKDKDTGFKGLHVDLVAGADGGVRRLEVIRISRPGRRVYGSYKDFYRVKAGLGILVVSTSRGMLAGEHARTKKLGGELICKAYFS